MKITTISSKLFKTAKFERISEDFIKASYKNISRSEEGFIMNTKDYFDCIMNIQTKRNIVALEELFNIEWSNEIFRYSVEQYNGAVGTGFVLFGKANGVEFMYDRRMTSASKGNTKLYGPKNSIQVSSLVESSHTFNFDTLKFETLK